MADNPLISIICPVYQAENYLQRCVDSILSQSFKELELLLVDDGSKDQSGTICDDYARKDPRVRVFHQPNRGVSSARNVGIDNAKGEYTIHADPDDWVEPDWLERLYEQAVKENADLVICDYFEHNNGTQTYAKQEVPTTGEKLLEKILEGMPTYCWNRLVKTECYTKRNIHFPENVTIWEDLYFFASLCIEDAFTKITHVEKALYHYDKTINGQSLVKCGNSKSIESQKWVIGYLDKHINDKSQLDNLKIMTMERLFLDKNATGDSVVKIYPEINDKYIDKKQYASPIWRAAAFTLIHPWCHNIVLKVMLVEFLLRHTLGVIKKHYFCKILM